MSVVVAIVGIGAPPRSNEPTMTGTILPDLAKVTTGKDTPLARANEVNAFAHTWVAPDRANMSWGRFLVPPVNSKPRPPMITLAKASRAWRNQAAVNFSPAADL